MRVAVPLLVLVLAAALSGCSGPGYLMGLRQDKADRIAVTRVLARQATGRPFAARALLAKPWTRLWVFGDRATTQGIEDRIGLPFPRSEQPVARGASYLVFVDAKAVVSAFSAPPSSAGSFACLRGGQPLGPGSRLVPRPGGPRRLEGVGRENAC